MLVGSRCVCDLSHAFLKECHSLCGSVMWVDVGLFVVVLASSGTIMHTYPKLKRAGQSAEASALRTHQLLSSGWPDGSSILPGDTRWPRAWTSVMSPLVNLRWPVCLLKAAVHTKHVYMQSMYLQIFDTQYMYLFVYGSECNVLCSVALPTTALITQLIS